MCVYVYSNVQVYICKCVNGRMYHNWLYICLFLWIAENVFLSENCDKIVYHIFNHDNLLFQYQGSWKEELIVYLILALFWCNILNQLISGYKSVRREGTYKLNFSKKSTHFLWINKYVHIHMNTCVYYIEEIYLTL